MFPIIGQLTNVYVGIDMLCSSVKSSCFLFGSSRSHSWKRWYKSSLFFFSVGRWGYILFQSVLQKLLLPKVIVWRHNAKRM